MQCLTHVTVVINLPSCALSRLSAFFLLLLMSPGLPPSNTYYPAAATTITTPRLHLPCKSTFASPQDFIFQYRQGVEGVTAAQVLEAAQRHLHPRQHVVVVVGDAATIRPMLQAINAKVVPLYLESAGST